MIKKPILSIQTVESQDNYLGNVANMDEAELQAEFERRLQKFVGCINNEQTKAKIQVMCYDFVEQLRQCYPGYCAQLGFDIKTNKTSASIQAYPKNIRTLLMLMGYPLEALSCPEDVEMYECSLGKFVVKDGRARLVVPEEEDDTIQDLDK